MPKQLIFLDPIITENVMCNTALGNVKFFILYINFVQLFVKILYYFATKND